jgi:ribosomal protein L37AE/L43A
MPGGRIKQIWADPNREGKSKGRQGERYCKKCGNTLQTARILKTLNLCEFCVKELENKRDGVWSCRSCGKVAPAEIKEHHGYCAQCVCAACGRFDPYVKKVGLCQSCATAIGDFCRVCGKEASAQVRKNRGLCDQCAKK